jgi:serine phosphatase RsbU (regulator of sigma subunit)
MAMWDWVVIGGLAVALAALGVWLAILVARGRKAQWRFEILAEIAAVSDAAGSLEETFDAICDILVPAVADFCAIDVIDQGQPRRAALRVAPGVGSEVETGLKRRRPSLPEPMVEGEDEAALRPRFFERMSERNLRELAHDEEDLEFLRGIGVRSAITVALQARRQVKGALTLAVAWSGRRYRADDAQFAWVLSGRVALALDNSGLFADLERAEGARAEIAETLQHGLLPPPLPHIPGWSLAAMYRPAGAENEVGGDFYDAFRIAGGWLLVIGDVTGRGARAASITALARYTLRTAAELTDDPLVALTTLNRALLARHDASLCSIAALSLSEDPADPVRIAVAGHLPPLLVDGEEVSEAADADPVLGAFGDVGWKISELAIEPGQQLVVVTDGITEANGEAGRFGEERLRAELAGSGNPAHAVQRLEAALRSFTAGAPDDDAAILAIARAPSGPPAVDDVAPAAAAGKVDGRGG